MTTTAFEDLLAEIFKEAANELFVAVQKRLTEAAAPWVTSEFFRWFPFNPTYPIIRTIEALDNLVGDIRNIPTDAILKVVVKGVRFDPMWQTKVMRVSDVMTEGLEFLATDGRDIVTLRSPMTIRLLAVLTSRFKLLNILWESQTVREAVLKVLAKFTKIPWVKVVSLVFQVLAIIASIFGLIALFAIMSAWVTRMRSTVPFRKILGQTTPRKMIRSDMGPIRRRLPGGVRP